MRGSMRGISLTRRCDGHVGASGKERVVGVLDRLRVVRQKSGGPQRVVIYADPLRFQRRRKPTIDDRVRVHRDLAFAVHAKPTKGGHTLFSRSRERA